MWGAHLIFAGPRGLGKPTCRWLWGTLGACRRRGLRDGVGGRLAVLPIPTPLHSHSKAEARSWHCPALTPLLTNSPGPNFVFNLYHTW